MLEPVLFHGGKYQGFSDFSAHQVLYKGFHWMTSEHAYQAAKFGNAGVRRDIMAATSAHQALKIARANIEFIRPGWDAIRISTMEAILRAKVNQHPDIAKVLLETGDRPIFEDAPKDAFWGRGPDWKGESHLGKLWMKLREELCATGKIATE